MNRKQRRAAQGRQCSTKILDLQRRVEQTGRPGLVTGLTDACRDCHADGELILLPGQKIVGQIYHSDGCPALAGVVAWEPVPDRDP